MSLSQNQWPRFLMPLGLGLLLTVFMPRVTQAYCPGELGEAFKAQEFRTRPPDTLHRRMLYLDYWRQELTDSIGLKILFFRVLRHHPKMTWDDLLAEMIALKKRINRAGVDRAMLVDRPLFPSFKIFDPAARDVVASEVAEIRKTFEAIVSLDFIDHLLVFSTSPSRREEFIKDVYVAYKLNVSAPSVRSEEHRQRAIRGIHQLFARELRNVLAMEDELKATDNKSALIHAVLQTLTERFISASAGHDVFRKWTLKTAKTLILFDHEFLPPLLSEDVVAQAQALERFYTRLPHLPVVSGFPSPLLDPIRELRTQVPTLFHEWERQDLRKNRRAGFVEFLPVPRILAFYLAPDHLLPYAFHPEFGFYTIEQGMQPPKLLGVGVYEDSSGKYLAITHLPDLGGDLLTRMFGTLQVLAHEKGLKGVVLPRNQRRWPSDAAQRANHLIDENLSPLLLQPVGRALTELSHRGLLNQARALGRHWLVVPQDEFMVMKPLSAQALDVHGDDLNAFRDFVREFFEAAQQPHMDLDIIEQIEILLELMKRSNLPDANPIISTFKDLYKIVYEDRVQEFLEDNPQRAARLANSFVDFFRHHPKPEVRYEALEVMEKIMKRELGISVEVAKPQPEEKRVSIDWRQAHSPVLVALLSALRSDDYHRVRLSIMILLARLDLEHFFPEIIDRAKFDPSEDVQRQAIWYLKSQGRPEHKDDLKYIEKNGPTEDISLLAYEARLAIIDREQAEALRDEYRRRSPDDPN